jgi:hypothetical protein
VPVYQLNALDVKSIGYLSSSAWDRMNLTEVAKFPERNIIG